MHEFKLGKETKSTDFSTWNHRQKEDKFLFLKKKLGQESFAWEARHQDTHKETY